jgi:Flp pilus assembly protein TadG
MQQILKYICGRSIVRREDGTAMAEFALTAAVFMSLLLGVIEFGFATWDKNSVTTDAREGARYAMVHGSTSGRIADSAMVANYVKSRTSLDNTIVVITRWADAGKLPGTNVTVKVKHSVPRRGPFLAGHTDSSSSTLVIVY